MLKNKVILILLYRDFFLIHKISVNDSIKLKEVSCFYYKNKGKLKTLLLQFHQKAFQNFNLPLNNFI